MAVSLPTRTDAGALADWAEITLLTGDGSLLSYPRILRLLRGEASSAADEELGKEDSEELDEAEEELDLPSPSTEGEAERDLRIELLHEEIELRGKLGPRLYPFETREDRLGRRDACGEWVYLFLLVLSSADASYREERRANEVETAYDLIALEALRRYLGRNATGVRFARGAHDPDDPETRPKKFREAITWLRDRLDLGRGIRTPPDWETEVHWEFEDVPDRPILNSYKDGGADVVIWWRFEDDRHGFPVLLGQCTVQIEWAGKAKDISVDLWQKWIDFSTVPPQRALVIPFAEDRTSEQWADRTVSAGVIVDRVRFLELLNELDGDVLSCLVDRETCEWIDRELASI